MTIMNKDRATAPLFMKIRNLLILALAGRRTVVLNVELSLEPPRGETLLTINGNGGLFCNVKLSDLKGLAVRLNQWGGE